ncbi:MAG: helix-turn-helix domain-containing protein [Streptosporangiales bacterium]
MAEVRKGSRISGEARDQMATEMRRRYEEEGWSIRRIAADVNRSYGFVHRVLSESGVPLRGRGGATRRKAKT